MSVHIEDSTEGFKILTNIPDYFFGIQTEFYGIPIDVGHLGCLV